MRSSNSGACKPVSPCEADFQTKLLHNLADGATPLSETFFRAVEFRWMHLDDVMSGEGTAKLGGRFAMSKYWYGRSEERDYASGGPA